jgi:fibronectin-binding autotransporter adhesin
MALLKKRRLFTSVIAAAAAVTCVGFVPSVKASVYTVTTGTGSWNATTNWDTGVVPNAVGANATFNGAATGSNAAQTANRTATLDGGKTVGSILFNDDLSTFTNTISNGTGGPLTFDNGGAGATITTQGAGTGNNTISATTVFTDNVTAAVNQTAATSAAGSLNLTAAISGAGSFTKTGDGLATFGTGAKTYTGATFLNGGRLRISTTAAPTATSSFTINSGGQLDMISTGTYSLGTGTVNLNGSGPAVNPGAIRNDATTLVSLSNAINLQSAATIIESGNALNNTTLTLTGNVNGVGSLIIGDPGGGRFGVVTLTGTNGYSGGTTVSGETLIVGAAGSSLGTGDVNIVTSSNASVLQIQSGVTNAIADTATLALQTGGSANLGSGVNDTVGGLVLGGVAQTTPGTYGSSASGATFQNDAFFSGTGVITLAATPEPATLSLLGLAAAGLVSRRRRSR